MEKRSKILFKYSHHEGRLILWQMCPFLSQVECSKILLNFNNKIACSTKEDLRLCAKERTLKNLFQGSLTDAIHETYWLPQSRSCVNSAQSRNFFEIWILPLNFFKLKKSLILFIQQKKFLFNLWSENQRSNCIFALNEAFCHRGRRRRLNCDFPIMFSIFLYKFEKWHTISLVIKERRSSLIISFFRNKCVMGQQQ